MGEYCRFTDIGRGSKDMGDQHEASALRDEVCLFYQILKLLVHHKR